ncbi:MAG TPA: P1 family peptidase, partial [Bacteroidota bacterium]|nr:P1 family peptidase [Bacteroidota bacterium]
SLSTSGWRAAFSLPRTAGSTDDWPGETLMTIPRGFSIGHWTDSRARTGCTVVLAPGKTVGGCDVRGSSPGTRETALLESGKKMDEVHALLLSGGSAYGLAAADGVMKFLEERGIGYRTPWGIVPIVPGAVVFDLGVGSASVRPGPSEGYAAASAASAAEIPEGAVGGGTGATVGKWGGPGLSMQGGFGLSSMERGPLIVSAASVVNALGDVIDDKGEIVAGARNPDGSWCADSDPLRTLWRAAPSSNTVLVAVLTNAILTKVDANRVAMRAHDGMARAVRPVHTSYDGDTVFCLASGEVPADIDLVAEMAARVTAMSIRRAVTVSPAP